MLPMNQRKSESRNIIFPPCSYRARRQGWSSKWSASAMRGAKSDGNKRAKGILVDRRRAAMRGASSGRGAVIMRSMAGSGGDRWVKEWVSIGFVGTRQAWICCAMRCV